MITEHSLVVLNTDYPCEKIVRGDIGTIVHVYENSYEVEFVKNDKTVAVVTVKSEDVYLKDD